MTLKQQLAAARRAGQTQIETADAYWCLHWIDHRDRHPDGTPTGAVTPRRIWISVPKE